MAFSSAVSQCNNPMGSALKKKPARLTAPPAGVATSAAPVSPACQPPGFFTPRARRSRSHSPAAAAASVNKMFSEQLELERQASMTALNAAEERLRLERHRWEAAMGAAQERHEAALQAEREQFAAALLREREQSAAALQTAISAERHRHEQAGGRQCSQTQHVVIRPDPDCGRFCCVDSSFALSNLLPYAPCPAPLPPCYNVRHFTRSVIYISYILYVYASVRYTMYFVLYI